MIRCAVVVVVAIGATVCPVLAYSSGAPDGYSGGPGDDTCVMCHASYGLNTGPGLLTISGPEAYEPGQTYAVTVTLSHEGQARWGFQFSPLGSGSCTITDPTTTQSSTSGGRTYVTHTTAGTFPGTPGPASWTFNWTAPEEPSASVTFYATGNAANGNGSPDGDYVYTATYTVGLVPVELARFAATYEGGVVVLRWRTLTEQDNAGFRIYRSRGDRQILVSPPLIPGAGTSSLPRDYRYVDAAVEPGGEYTYRLMEVSLAGREALAGTAAVRIPRGTGLMVMPTVVVGHQAVSILNAGSGEVEITDVAGRLVARVVHGAGGEAAVWDLSDDNGLRVTPGVYLCRDRRGLDASAVPVVVVR